MSSSRLKIIVAEDNALQRDYLCRVINALGYDAIGAANGKVALDELRATSAQIVISDWQMPQLDGIALTCAIRALDLAHYVHVIMVTGRGDKTLRHAALLAGADDFLNKGDSPALLRARLRTATRLINHAAELAKNAQIIQDTNDRIHADLQAAAKAQQQLLPQTQGVISGVQIACAFVPSAIVSGDMFSCFALGENKLGFYAVDVSGHGVHASLLSVAIGHLITPAYFRENTYEADGICNPAGLVSALNARFSGTDNDDYFTMFCGVIDTASGRLDYCQAGYPSPCVVTRSGVATALGDGGFPVGMLPDAAYENNVARIAKGAAVVLCSDAASEAENLDGVPFGPAGVQAIAATISQNGIADFPQKVVRALGQWRSDVPLEDDLTVMVLQRKVSDDTCHAL